MILPKYYTIYILCNIGKILHIMYYCIILSKYYIIYSVQYYQILHNIYCTTLSKYYIIYTVEYRQIDIA